MKFIYTKHAKLRINQRELSKKQIEGTVINSNKILYSFKGRLIAQRNFGTKTLEVIYKKLNGVIVIITAYYLKEA
jgi:translation initiation factor IF-3